MKKNKGERSTKRFEVGRYHSIKEAYEGDKTASQLVPSLHRDIAKCRIEQILNKEQDFVWQQVKGCPPLPEIRTNRGSFLLQCMCGGALRNETAFCFLVRNSFLVRNGSF